MRQLDDMSAQPCGCDKGANHKCDWHANMGAYQEAHARAADKGLRVYLAAPWVERERMPLIAASIEAAGLAITERWWEHADIAGYPDRVSVEGFNELRRQAVADMVGVLRADLFVLCNFGKSEGKAVETGLAILANVPIVLIGERSNIFHFMVPDSAQFHSVDDAMAYLRTYRPSQFASEARARRINGGD